MNPSIPLKNRFLELSPVLKNKSRGDLQKLRILNWIGRERKLEFMMFLINVKKKSLLWRNLQHLKVFHEAECLVTRTNQSRMTMFRHLQLKTDHREKEYKLLVTLSVTWRENELGPKKRNQDLTKTVLIWTRLEARVKEWVEISIRENLNMILLSVAG